PAKRDAVVDHEVHDSALVHATEVPRGHAEIMGVVRQEFAGRSLQRAKDAGEHQAAAGQRQQRAAVACYGLEKPTLVAAECGQRHPSVSPSDWNREAAAKLTPWGPCLSKPRAVVMIGCVINPSLRHTMRGAITFAVLFAVAAPARAEDQDRY